MLANKLSVVYIWGWISKFSQVAAGLLTVPLIISSLGVSNYAEYTYLISIFLFLAYLDLSIPTSLLRIISKYKNKSFNKYQNTVIFTAKRTLILLSIIVFIVAFFFVFIRLSEAGNDILGKLLTLIAIIIYCASFPFRISGSLLQAHGKIIQIDKVMTSISLLKIGVIFIAIRFEPVQIEWWLLIFVLGEFFTHFLQYFFNQSSYSSTPSQISEFSSKHRNYLVKFGFSISVIALINFLILNSPVWVLHSLKGFEAYVSAYSLAIIISVNFFTVIGRYQTVTIPKSISISQLIRKKVLSGALRYLVLALLISYIFYVSVLMLGYFGLLHHWLKSEVIANATLRAFSIVFPGYIFYQITTLFRNFIVMNIGRYGVIKLLFGIYIISLGFLYLMPSILQKLGCFAFLLCVVGFLSLFNSKKYDSSVMLSKYYLFCAGILTLFILTCLFINIYGANSLMNI